MARRLRSRTITTSASAVGTVSSSSSEEDKMSESTREAEAGESDVTDVPISTVSATLISSLRPRKRIRRSGNWKKNVRKKRRNAGLRYISDTTNRVVRYYCCTCTRLLEQAHINHFFLRR